MIKYLLNISLVVVLMIIGTSLYAGNHKSHSKQLDGISSGNSSISDDYRLYQNFPNPFNPVTKLSYKINNAGYVTLKVYNLVGQEVKVLVSENQKPGVYNVTFNGSELTTGIYLYKLQVNDFTSVKRMTLIK